MKRYLVIVIFIIGFLYFFIKPPQSDNKQNTIPYIPTPTPTSEKTNHTFAYSLNNQSYHAVSFFVDDNKTIQLIPNFTKSISSQTAYEQHKCQFLSNGGFYSTENTPIGLFITNGIQINSYQPNALFNGFFSVSSERIAKITNQATTQRARLEIQSGPLAIFQGNEQKLHIRNDEPARRVVVVESTSHAIIFLMLYSSENIYKGPLLADLPTHLKKIESIIDISILHALNLDGGSASAFITHDESIMELTPVGSFFCVSKGY